MTAPHPKQPVTTDRSRDLCGYGRRPPAVPMPGGARVAVSIAVQLQEGAELAPVYGDAGPEKATEGLVTETGHRDLFVESLYEYGSRRGVWRLLEVLEAHDVRATFFCCGATMEANPQLIKEIDARGHEIAGHGYRWIRYRDVESAHVRADVRRCVQAFEETLGRGPRGWLSRSPSPETRAILQEEVGLTYDSDAYDDDLPHHVPVEGGHPQLVVPHTLTLSDEKFWSIPSVAGFTNPRAFRAALIAGFEWLHAEGEVAPKVMPVSLRPRISGRPERSAQVDAFLHRAKDVGDVWFARRVDLAEWWIEAEVEEDDAHAC